MIGDAIARAFAYFIVAVVVATAGVTAALIFGIPWLWHVLKPWLHTVTG